MKDYQSLYAYNLHDNYMRENYDKLYPSSSYIYDENQLLSDIKNKLNFKEYKYKLYGNKAEKGLCPSCSKSSCFLTVTKEDSNKYQLICGDRNCGFKNGKKSILLHELPKHYPSIVSGIKVEKGSKEKVLPYNWKGIKPENRRKKKETI